MEQQQRQPGQQGQGGNSKKEVCGTHAHYQFVQGYLCSSPFDPEPGPPPSQCYWAVIEVIYYTVTLPPQVIDRVFDIVGYNVLGEAIWGWVSVFSNPLDMVYEHVVREYICDGY